MSNLKEYNNLFLPTAIVLASLILGASLIYSGGVNITTQDKSDAQLTAGTVAPEKTVDNNDSAVTFTIEENDHAIGNPNAKITFVEFSDFQCSFCSRFHLTVKQVLSEYGNDVRWVFKHFPLDSIHNQARPAAEAAECIWEQKGNDGFWGFADAMFENQIELGTEFYREIAQEMGVNLSQFDSCVSERKYQDKVEAQNQEGIAAGVQGTPGSFVNGMPVRGAVPFEQLKSIIDSQL